MKQIKPGRGPSMMGGITGIFMICIGIVWTILASEASPFFALFGLFWTGIAVVNTIYQFKNATGKHRYSAFDITDDTEEPDPLNQRFHPEPHTASREGGSAFCPYCGAQVEKAYQFCNKCGRELP